MPRPGRKENVLEAAVALFSRKGYHGTTVRDIAEESGMLSGSLYAHIAGKEDLLYTIVLGAADQFMAAVEPVLAGPGTASAKLRAAMAAHVRVMAESRDAATVFMHEWQALGPERRSEVAERRNQYERLFAAIIEQGVASGEFRASLDSRFARLLVLSAVNWLYEWYDPAGPLGPDEIAERFATLILEGLVAPAGTAEPTERGGSYA